MARAHDLSERTAVVAASGVLAARVGSELLLLDPATSRYTRLNESAAFLWGLLERPVTVAQLAEALAERCAIDRARSRADAGRLVAALAERGLVHVRPGPSSCT